MEYKENGYASRAEMIRMARENCNLSLGAVKNIHTDKIDEDERRLIESGPDTENGTIYITKMQGFVFRVVVAAVIFLCVMLMDRYEIGNDTVNRESIKGILTSSEQAHQVEDMAREWVNEKMPAVFRLSKE